MNDTPWPSSVFTASVTHQVKAEAEGALSLAKVPAKQNIKRIYFMQEETGLKDASRVSSPGRQLKMTEIFKLWLLPKEMCCKASALTLSLQICSINILARLLIKQKACVDARWCSNADFLTTVLSLTNTCGAQSHHDSRDCLQSCYLLPDFSDTPSQRFWILRS